MYAIVKLGGKQWKLEEKEKILVDKLPFAKDKDFLLEEVLLLKKNNDCLVGTPFVEKATVKLKVLEQTRDKKIIVFKKKRRKGYKRTQGHRQYKTLLLVEKILLNGKPILENKKATTSNIKDQKPEEVKTVDPKQKAIKVVTPTKATNQKPKTPTSNKK